MLRDERERSCPQKESTSGYSSGLSPGVVALADSVPLWSDHAWERRSLCEDDAEGKRRFGARGAQSEFASLHVRHGVIPLLA